jgi:hypothetical protein
MNSTRRGAILSPARATLFLVVAMLAGCRMAPPADRVATPAPAAPVTAPLPAPTRDGVRYIVDAAASDVRILVYRGGPLAKVGHNHVLRVRDLRGEVILAEPIHRSRFALSFPVAALEVDPPDARADEGPEFAAPPSPQAIAATRGNLLGPAVLDAGRYPEITLRSVSLTGPPWGPHVTVRVALHGIERDIAVPVALQRDGHVLSITAFLTLRTADFGITPFTVLGGGLRVENAMDIRARIIARRESPAR